MWLTDKDGKIINEPQDFMNHLMDAGRYGMESLKPRDEITTHQAKQHNTKAINRWSIR
jgi:hypothetical protein